MIRQGKEIRAFRDSWRDDTVAIYLCDHDEQGKRLVARSVEYAPDDGGLHFEPTVRLLPERAQALMDDLWQAGVRPTQGRQSEGVTAAQARHLEDMRAIAFEKLEVEKPA